MTGGGVGEGQPTSGGITPGCMAQWDIAAGCAATGTLPRGGRHVCGGTSAGAVRCGIVSGGKNTGSPAIFGGGAVCALSRATADPCAPQKRPQQKTRGARSAHSVGDDTASRTERARDVPAGCRPNRGSAGRRPVAAVAVVSAQTGAQGTRGKRVERGQIPLLLAGEPRGGHARPMACAGASGPASAAIIAATGQRARQTAVDRRQTAVDGRSRRQATRAGLF